MSMGSLHAPPQHSIRLYLLGSFRLERSGYLLSLPTRKAEALLAYLVLYPGVHAREKVAALFWGDSSDEHSRRSLRTALSVLRGGMAGANVCATPGDKSLRYLRSRSMILNGRKIVVSDCAVGQNPSIGRHHGDTN